LGMTPDENGNQRKKMKVDLIIYISKFQLPY